MNDFFDTIWKVLEIIFKGKIKMEISANFKEAIGNSEKKSLKRIAYDLADKYEILLTNIGLLPGFNLRDLNSLIIDAFALALRYNEENR